MTAASEVEVDVAVVGAGPAGIAAALAAAESGARTVVIDEQPEAGGHLRWDIEPVTGVDVELDGQPGVRVAEQLRRRLADSAVDVRSRTIAWGLFDDHLLGLAGPNGAAELRAAAVIVASGSTDLVEPFPGGTLPGVMTARALQIFLHLHRVLPARRFVILGPDSRAVERAIELAGAAVVGRAGGVASVEALGRDRVERVSMVGRAVPADGVVLALGRQPDAELALQAQAEAVFAPEAGGWVPLRSERLETTTPSIFVAGEAGGNVDLAEAMAEGRLAGLVAAGASAARTDEAISRLRASRGGARQELVDRLRPGAWVS